MPEANSLTPKTLRLRFAPSPPGFLHVGSARTFIFNWLYARHNQGTMVLRLDDTDVERNTEASVQSIFEGLRWLGLSWDEEYKQSEGRALQPKPADEVEDFSLLRSDGNPTYHLASCVDDADLRISHIIRGQDHLTNTFKHLLIFEGLGATAPHFAHLPLLVAPDGAKLSKRKHGPVVSVTTYRDAGFLPQAFINFLCLLGWSPKNDREFMTVEELTATFTIEGVNRANAVVNFKEDDPFDPKAIWLNAEHIRALPVDQLCRELQPFFEEAGFHASSEKVLAVTPLIRERIKLLRDAVSAADFFFLPELAPYDPAELIPQKGDAAMARRVLETAKKILAETPFDHDSLDKALRGAASELGLKAGQAFQPIRVAVCGRKNAPPLFETMVVLGREVCLARIHEAEAHLQSLN